MKAAAPTPAHAGPQPSVAGSDRGVALANMAWLLADKALALVIGLVIFGLIARTHGPVGSGHFAYGAAMLQTGLGLSLVCAGVALLPRFCRMQGALHGALPGALANVFALRLVASLLAMGAMMLFCLLTVAEPERRRVAIVMLLAVPLIEPFYIVATYWLSRNHNRPTVIARSSGLMVRAVLVGIGLWAGLPMWVLALAWVLEAGVNAALQSLQARQVFAGRSLRSLVRLPRMRAYLGFGLRFVLALWLSQLFLRLDRLVLAERMNPHDFGLYAAPMQLVEVWSQVAYLIGSSIATAYLYRRLGAADRVRAFLVTAAAMAGIGLLGLGGAWLLGPWLLRSVFGPEFVGSLPYLVAGSAFAVLLFADQAVDMLITANNQPWRLALKWGVAAGVAALVLWQGYERLGAFAGPAGLACGIVAAWLVLLLGPRLWGGRPVPPGPGLAAAIGRAPAVGTK